MYDKTFAFFVTLLFATALASDQKYWIEQAEKNAQKDLSQWPKAVDSLVIDGDVKPVKDQILFLQSQVSDSVDNMNEFVPQLIWVVESINSTAAGSPNFIRRGILHTILWYIRGKRDNKSYYLLDGAANWISNRVLQLRSKGGRAADLAVKLTVAEKIIADLRDELDSDAQKYVKGVTKIDELSSDISKNILEIRALSNATLADFYNSPLLANATKANEFVKGITL